MSLKCLNDSKSFAGDHSAPVPGLFRQLSAARSDLQVAMLKIMAWLVAIGIAVKHLLDADVSDLSRLERGVLVAQ